MTEHRLPILHRAGRAWVIADTGLFIMRQGQWKLTALRKASSEWLRRHALLDARFRTRRQALEVAAAYLADDPLALLTTVPLSRLGAGRYQTSDGRWQVTAAGADGWRVARTAEPDSALLQPTLHTAANLIATYEAEATAQSEEGLDVEPELRNPDRYF